MACMGRGVSAQVVISQNSSLAHCVGGLGLKIKVEDSGKLLSKVNSSKPEAMDSWLGWLGDNASICSRYQALPSHGPIEPERQTTLAISVE